MTCSDHFPPTTMRLDQPSRCPGDEPDGLEPEHVSGAGGAGLLGSAS
jgi:hypothetical protein